MEKNIEKIYSINLYLEEIDRLVTDNSLLISIINKEISPKNEYVSEEERNRQDGILGKLSLILKKLQYCDSELYKIGEKIGVIYKEHKNN